MDRLETGHCLNLQIAPNPVDYTAFVILPGLDDDLRDQLSGIDGNTERMEGE